MPAHRLVASGGFRGPLAATASFCRPAVQLLVPMPLHLCAAGGMYAQMRDSFAVQPRAAACFPHHAAAGMPLRARDPAVGHLSILAEPLFM